ncbi:hypothetical protein [Spirosoma gilvum]
MEQLKLSQSYSGFYQLVRLDRRGTAHFRADQKVDNIALAGNALMPEDRILPVFPPAVVPPLKVTDLEVVSINWSVNKKGILRGSAQFISLHTHDVVYATLSGTSPEPPAGQEFREAHVTVTFTGGSRGFTNAKGTAKVNARLFADGRSIGTLDGTVEIP